ncbi:MAG: hypothetical protein ACK4VW_04270 [Anaerolineales bacterium]
MGEARQSLTARGILTPHREEGVVMDVVAAALVGTLIAPRAAFLLTRTVPDLSSRQINLYHRPPLTVAMEQREGQWVLRFLPETDAIVHQAREL